MKRIQDIRDKIPTISLGLFSLLLGFLGQAAWSQSGWFFLVIGALFYGMGIFLFLSDASRVQKPKDESVPGLRAEWAWVSGLMVLAFILRVYRLDSNPPGLFIDQGFGGWGGLRILHEGWRPFGIQEIIFNWPLPLYQLACWFLLFKPSAWSLLLFFVILGLAAFPLIYLAFRRLAGAPTALGSLFFLTIMFWHINFSRNGHWTGLTLLYIFATLFLLQEGLETLKHWKFGLAAFFFAAGFYTYQSYKIFPVLLLVYLIYEYRFAPRAIRSQVAGILLFLAISAGLCVPLVWDWFQHGIFSGREKPIFIARIILEQKSLQPLWNNLVQWALLFNHSGEADPLNRVGQEPMLDPVTGVLFLFGFFYSLKTPLRKENFYPLAGFLVLSLPALLANGFGSYRMAGILPFVAFFAAKALVLLWGGMVQAARGKIRFCLHCAWVGLLLYAGFQNTKSYFVDMAENNDRWLHFSMDATSVGKAAGEHPDRDYCLSPYFYQHPTVRFLSYFQKNLIHLMEIPTGLTPVLDSPETQVCFAVEKGKKGWLDLLRWLYPGGRTEEVKDLKGGNVVSFYDVSRKTVDSFRGLIKSGPGEWHGCFRADRVGLYRFHFPKTGQIRMEIGGHRVQEGTALSLLQGFYSFRLKAQALKEPAIDFVDPKGTDHILDGSYLTALSLNHGLLCRYAQGEKPIVTPFRWDPLINFVSTGDLPYPALPFQAEWTGRLLCPSKGLYGFLLLTTEMGQLWLDGKMVVSGTQREANGLYLSQGFHTIRLTLRRDMGRNEVQMDFHLLWEKPGQIEYEIVPPSAYGETHCL